MTVAILEGFFQATVRSATPLAFAALGELIAERSGVINIGLEGAIACGAFASFVAALMGGPGFGFLAGGLVGAAVALLFGVFVLAFRAQQVIVGTAVSMFGLGLSASLYRTLIATSGSTSHVTTLRSLRVPYLSDLPLVGSAVFSQPAPTYLLYLLFPAASWFLYHTVGGIALRAVGEHPSAAVASGHSPSVVQLVAVIMSGFLAGLGGSTLVIAQAGTFSDGMSAGRGFIAIAIVALGRWTPRGVAVATLVFGAITTIQFLTQSMGWRVPYTIVLASPYVLTLAAMAAFRGSRTAPAALGKSLRTDE